MASKPEIHCRSIPRQRNDVAEKHARLVRSLSSLGGRFSPTPSLDVPPKMQRTHPCWMVSCRGKLGKGVGGRVTYQNRAYMEDNAQFDDHLEFELPTVAWGDGQDAIVRAMTTIAKSFSAYVGYVTNEEIFLAEGSNRHSTSDPKRTVVERVFPANYWSKWLCGAAFGLSPVEVANRVRDLIAVAEADRNGVVVVTDWSAWSVRKCLKTDRLIRRALKRRR
jgi:hypothetical protein